ncbi:esterase/lipase family protein [Actinomadura kijaniata]|uniref:esterase/lipase family protein n=1 Tax=Actinomadura kijaniata TaxID=46161 RepID=UPI0008306814|nr:hypothetical protein [Actinomadura kijaniata]
MAGRSWTGKAEPIVQAWNILGTDLTPSQGAPGPDQRWDFDGGFALVYLTNSRFGPTRPVIFADGFDAGPSDPDAMWAHVQGEGEDTAQPGFRLAEVLRASGHDLIMLGYHERSAPIQDNAQVAIDCVARATHNKIGDTPLAVGGFSMGGLVTRYALLKMEKQRRQHQTAVYFSWDSPHRGAWIPISLQALAHYLKDQDGIAQMSDHVNSPAARQMLRWHIETVDDDHGTEPDSLRRELLSEMEQMGTWPSGPRLLGLASGSGDGTRLPIPTGTEMLKVTGLLHPYRTTTLYAQTRLVAHLKRQRVTDPPPPVDKRTNGLPELDSAPGGRLRSFGIARNALAQLGAVESDHEWVDFVPTVSAVAIGDIDQPDELFTPVNSLPPENSELDGFTWASQNQEHSRVTTELAEWLLDRLPK